jgi:XTP/dITP diphosphohydrolase
MLRQFEQGRLVVASHNPGKVREIGDLLKPFKVSLVSAAALDLPEPVEDGLSFKANAIIKAKAAAERSSLPALSDDSGLAVTALGGRPGIFSARWADPGKGFQAAMQRVEDELGDTLDRSAQFVCALALAWPDDHVEVFEGIVAGTLIWPPRGQLGFGYDPMFLPEGCSETFGEMDPATKHDISHRADAFRQLVAGCFHAH